MQQFTLKVCEINPALHLLRPTVLIPLAMGWVQRTRKHIDNL